MSKITPDHLGRTAAAIALSQDGTGQQGIEQRASRLHEAKNVSEAK